MMPWRPLIVFATIAVGATTAIAVLCAARGWTLESPVWIALVPIAMWAPAAGALVARRSVDRDFAATVPLRPWPAIGARALLRPLAIPLLVYASAHAIAGRFGGVSWSPGGGRWTTPAQIAANVAVNLTILGVVGTFTAMGEEIGWRGYLQPRLDAAGVRASIVVVWLVQFAYHAPVIALAGYANVGGLAASLVLFAAGDLPWTFIAAHEAYRVRSVWPAILFHSFHNTISQWLFPRLFVVTADARWLRGEDGVLPAAGYAVVAALMWIAMRRRGRSWRAVAGEALAPSSSEGQPVGTSVPTV
jgi:CAAX protease family protein